MFSLTWSVVLLCTAAATAKVVNRTCYWKEPRAAVIQDTLYVDGGQIWEAQFDTTGKQFIKQASPWVSNFTSSGTVWKLYLGSSFSVSDDFPDLFVADDGAGVGGIDNNPPFRGGFMFADQYEYYTFGGISLGDEGRFANLSNYQLFQLPGASTEDWYPQCNTHYMPSAGVDRYITHGAGANIPSNKLGFYFSGMQKPSGGYIQEITIGIDSLVAVDGLIMIDMNTEGRASWTNKSSPTDAGILPRGGAALSWVPFGDAGLLVLVGGVPNPLNTDLYGIDSTSTTNLMQEVSVYDVAGDAWYTQSTSGDSPPQLADFCTVVAHEENTTSYQIYVFGGFDGSTATSSNSVWILSVPSFRWTEVHPLTAEGQTVDGRYGHVCAMPYPDQMIVVGGIGDFLAPMLGEIVQVLNLSSLQWQKGYDPKAWSYYQIPEVVNVQNPGQKAPDLDVELAQLFDTNQADVDTPWSTYKATSSNKDHWLAPVLGGVLGGVAVAVIGFLIWLFRRKKAGKSGRSSSSQPEMSETQVSSGDDGVARWRQHVKSMASSGVNEIDGSDRSTVNNDPPQTAAELGVRNQLFARHSLGSPELSAAAPRSPESASIEVSGDPSSRQEMQDTSPRQRPLNHAPSAPQQPDYRFRNHPLFPLNVDDMMSVSDGALTSAHGQVSSVDGEAENATVMSDRAAPLGRDDFNQFLYGRPPPLSRSEQAIAPLLGSESTSHRQSGGRMPYEEFYPGDALPSPAKKEPSSSRRPISTPNFGRAFAVHPMETGSQQPLLPSANLKDTKHPSVHQRTISDESTNTLQLPSPITQGVPRSPDPAEDRRRSTLIEAMPEHPNSRRQGADLAGTWPRHDHVSRAAEEATNSRATPILSTATAARRREVGSPVRSAYEQTKSRFKEY